MSRLTVNEHTGVQDPHGLKQGQLARIVSAPYVGAIIMRTYTGAVNLETGDTWDWREVDNTALKARLLPPGSTVTLKQVKTGGPLLQEDE